MPKLSPETATSVSEASLRHVFSPHTTRTSRATAALLSRIALSSRLSSSFYRPFIVFFTSGHLPALPLLWVLSPALPFKFYPCFPFFASVSSSPPSAGSSSPFSSFPSICPDNAKLIIILCISKTPSALSFATASPPPANLPCATLSS